MEEIISVFLLTFFKLGPKKASQIHFCPNVHQSQSQFAAQVITLTYEKEGANNWETICKCKKVMGVKIVSSCVGP